MLEKTLESPLDCRGIQLANQEEKGRTEEEMVVWHHRLSGERNVKAICAWMKHLLCLATHLVL